MSNNMYTEIPKESGHKKSSNYYYDIVIESDSQEAMALADIIKANTERAHAILCYEAAMDLHFPYQV